jgi:hypothetical protein
LRWVVEMLNMPQVTLARIRCLIFVLVATVTVAAALGGCMREDQGEGMTIWNRTSATVEVDYRRVVGTTEMEDPVMTIPSGQRVVVVGLYQAEGECLRGTLVATQDGRTMATLSQPCRGTEWEITQPEVSPSAVPPS